MSKEKVVEYIYSMQWCRESLYFRQYVFVQEYRVYLLMGWISLQFHQNKGSVQTVYKKVLILLILHASHQFSQ